jgi:hypothetical protein
MANPRAAVDFTEIDSRFVTYLRKTSSTGAIDYLRSVSSPYPATTSTQQGYSVAISANKTVKVGAAGDILVGKLNRSDGDGTCVVQDMGYMSFSVVNDANVPVLGRGVVCDGSGGVRIAASGSEWKERGVVVDLDTTNLVCTVKL